MNTTWKDFKKERYNVFLCIVTPCEPPFELHAIGYMKNSQIQTNYNHK